MVSDKPSVDSIFLAAVELQPEQRSTYLNEACGQDWELRTRVDRLLCAQSQVASFLESPAPELGATIDHPIAELPGTVIGQYKLLEQIGEGGMGVVFMAEQVKPVQRTVALKIIKPGMDTRQVIARFEAERQALALMDHPNIAKVLDAGTTDTGRPYFVMDLVKGVPITEYCDQQHLAIRERLDLFAQVCLAVQHAHQKGIIHRDLKPSNVLVGEYDSRPVPKVIDFGVAKATAQKLTERTMFTEYGRLIGTLEYMSPEQARFNQLDIDTRSDIYSLGVLLYELLAGSTPLETDRVRSAAFDEILRMIGEEEPLKPSTKISSSDKLSSLAANRQTEPARLSKDVSGELDWIVMKCLEKDRNRRYETTNGLALDVQRYLANDPVEACPPSAGYRFKKFVRRNSVSVMAASAIAAALAVGLTIAMVGFVRARTEAARSEQVAQFLEDMLAAAGPSVARGRDATLLREILNKTAERVEKDLKNQPEVQGDLWMTLGETYADIGDYPQAISMFQHTVDSYRLALGNENPKLARALGSLGRAQSSSGDTATGNINAELGLKVARLCGDKKVIARCLSARARSLDGILLLREATPLFREALALEKEVGGDPVFIASLMCDLGGCLDEPGARDEAESLMRESLALRRKHLDPDHPAILGSYYVLAQCLTKQHKLEEAETMGREIVAQARKVFDKDHRARLYYVALLASVLTYRDKAQDAEAILKETVESSPTNGNYWNLWGEFHAQRGEFDVATEQYSRASELAPDDVAIAFNLAAVLLKTGRTAEYRQHCHKLLERAANSPETGLGGAAAKSSLLLPVDGVDFTRACELADIAATAAVPNSRMRWLRLDKSLADYRRQRFDSSLEWANRAISSESATSQSKAAAYCVQACCYASLHQKDQARQAIMLADQENFRMRDRPWEYGGVWRDSFLVEFLRAEAAKLLGIEKSESDPASSPADKQPATTQ